jgi:hypothetical protein
LPEAVHGPRQLRDGRRVRVLQGHHDRWVVNTASAVKNYSARFLINNFYFTKTNSPEGSILKRGLGLAYKSTTTLVVARRTGSWSYLILQSWLTLLAKRNILTL